MYIPSRSTKQEITWNDGFNEFNINYEDSFDMENIPPSITITSDLGQNEYQIDPSAIDIDGTVDFIKWNIEYKTPFDNAYKLVKDDGWIGDIIPLNLVFPVQGHYRISGIVKDNYGAEGNDTKEVFIEYNANCDGEGTIKIQNNVWQMIAIPVRNVNIKEYFLDVLDSKIKVSDDTKSVSDVIEVANCYLGNENQFRSYVPGFTNATSINNFPLVYNDEGNFEVTAFWIKTKNFTEFYDQDLIFEWSQDSGV